MESEDTMVKQQSLHQLEQDMLAALSGSRLMNYTRMAAQGIRLSGSIEEKQVFIKIKEELDRIGFTTQLLEFPGYVSRPLESLVTVEETGEAIGPSITDAMAASTPEEGLVGELVYVGRGEREAYLKVDASGKIVVFERPIITGIDAPLIQADVDGKIAALERLDVPEIVARAEEHGCLATICISCDDHLHEGIVSTVWGNPTPETVGFLPKIPTVSIHADAGKRLRELMDKGTVRLRLNTRVEIGWETLPLLVADMVAPLNSDHFVFVSSHVDSWFYGAMDNAAANATVLEVARLLAKRRADWQRSLRLAFWSGHENGRYVGSTWYVDHHWEDLYKHSAVHVNVESTGGVGANDFSIARSMAETRALAATVIKEITGQQISGQRVERAGDQSFWGVMPSLFMEVSLQPPDGGFGWWWHTEHDTIDKIDEDSLVEDTKVYVLALARLMCSPVLPFNYVDVADEFLMLLQDLQGRAGEVFDLSPALSKARLLKERTLELQEVAGRVAEAAEFSTDRAAMRVNRCFRRLGRLLVPVNYSTVDPFDQSRAVSLPPIPVLQPVGELASMEPDSHEFRLLETRLVRERNRVCHALDQACQIIEDTLALENH